MLENLIKITKCISGNVLLVGVKNKEIYEEVENNENIFVCNSLLNCTKRSFFYSKNNKLDNLNKKTKTIKVKKIKKIFKKKKVDYILCNALEIRKNFKIFLSNSVYINNKMIYLYGNKKEIDIEDIKKKYNRYTKEIRIEYFDDDFIMYIDNKNSKNNILKDKFYYIIDTISNIRNGIADIMIG